MKRTTAFIVFTLLLCVVGFAGELDGVYNLKDTNVDFEQNSQTAKQMNLKIDEAAKHLSSNARVSNLEATVKGVNAIKIESSSLTIVCNGGNIVFEILKIEKRKHTITIKGENGNVSNIDYVKSKGSITLNYYGLEFVRL